MRKLATHLAVLIVGVAAGVGGVAAADNGKPPVAHSAASDTRIVDQLRDLNRTVKLMNRSLSGYDTIAANPSLQSLLHDICRNTRGDSFSGC